MASTVVLTDMADLVTATLDDIERMKISPDSAEYQEYIVMDKLLKKNVEEISDGTGIKKFVQIKLEDAFSHQGILDEDDVNIVDVLTEMNIRWAHGVADWGFTYHETIANRGKARLLDIFKPRMANAKLSMAGGLERAFWTLVGSTNNVKPYGAPYYLVKNATAGFNGGRPSGYTDVAGIDPNSNANWKNYTFSYVDTNRADLVKQMRTAMRKTRWVSPVTTQQFRDFGMKYVMYCNEVTLSDIEDVLLSQNDKLGFDVAPVDGMATIRRHPFQYTPYLDGESDRPIYGINHDTFHAVVQTGDNMRMTGPVRAPHQHNAFMMFIDLSYQFICLSRRRNFVAYVA